MALTEDQKKDILDLLAEGAAEREQALAKTVNAAVTTHTKRLEASLAKTIGEAIGSSLDEKIKAAIPAPPEPKPGEGKPGDTKIEDSPVFKGLEKRLADLQKQNEQARAEATAAKAKGQDATLRQSLSAALGKHSIVGDGANDATMILVDGQKRVAWSEDGETLTFKEADGTTVDLETGVASWAKSDQAKRFLPPRGTQGSGDRSGGRAPGSQPNAPPPGTIGGWLDGLTQGGPMLPGG